MHTLSSSFINRWCHAELRRCTLVHAAARIIASVVEGASHCPSILETRLEVGQAVGLYILTRGHALDPLEGALEMVRTQMNLLTQISKMQRSIQVSLNIAANLLDHLCLWLWHAGVLWMAAPARTKSSDFGLFRQPEEDDLLAARPTSGTRRTTINASGTHGKHECSISRSISRYDCLPAPLFVQWFLVD